MDGHNAKYTYLRHIWAAAAHDGGQENNRSWEYLANIIDSYLQGTELLSGPALLKQLVGYLLCCGGSPFQQFLLCTIVLHCINFRSTRTDLDGYLGWLDGPLRPGVIYYPLLPTMKYCHCCQLLELCWWFWRLAMGLAMLQKWKANASKTDWRNSKNRTPLLIRIPQMLLRRIGTKTCVIFYKKYDMILRSFGRFLVSTIMAVFFTSCEQRPISDWFVYSNPAVVH